MVYDVPVLRKKSERVCLTVSQNEYLNDYLMYTYCTNYSYVLRIIGFDQNSQVALTNFTGKVKNCNRQKYLPTFYNFLTLY